MKKIIILAALFALLACAVFFVSRRGERVEADDRETKLAAYDRMEACMEAVKRYREEAGIPLAAEDRFATGLIGLEWSGISTTLGDVQAKRTTASPDMAALCVQLLAEAGLKAGDVAGVGASGSFPAMNIALLCACEESGITARVIPSAGSSAWGANHPELPFPLLLQRLKEDGLLHCDILFATMGGDYDTGAEMDGEARSTALAAMEGAGLRMEMQPDFEKNLALRMEAYGRIDCFAGVGGNWTTLGMNADTLPAGVIMPSRTLGTVNGNSGLLERYHAAGIPVIHLMNIKKLAADYDLAFDPQAWPARGESAVFHTVRYPKALILAVLAVVFAVTVSLRFRRGEDGSVRAA